MEYSLSLEFSGLLILAIIAIIVLANRLNYKNHCIEDLEGSIRVAKKRKNEEFIDILLRLKDFQNFEPATRDTNTRRLINEAIEKYSSENRKGE